jgi:crotonobetainyl-CoA:carnitine CoA-transferase CaiB-like acyl-CoA transferase
MYQAGVMFMSDYLMDAISNGRDGERIGNRHLYRAPQGCYPAQGDNEWIALSVGTDEQWQSLCKVLGREDLAQDARFADLLSRQRNHDELDKVIEVWSAERDKYDMMHQLQGVGIPAGPVLTGKDVHFDPQYKSRGFLERVEYPEERGLGSRIFMGRPYKFSNTPLRIRGPAPTFGQDNERLLKELLGLKDDVYQGLVQDSITAEIPLAGNPVPRIPQERMVELGLMAAWDPEYREHLGLS